jgi:hypothetical protein
MTQNTLSARRGGLPSEAITVSRFRGGRTTSPEMAAITSSASHKNSGRSCGMHLRCLMVDVLVGGWVGG